jgi:hypothetical protein
MWPVSDELKRLVESLSGRGFDSPYLERLKRGPSLRPREVAMNDVQQEIRSEMAAALGRSGERADQAFLLLEMRREELERCRSELAAGLATSAEVEAKVRAFNAQRDIAFQRREELKVHREAFGLRSHAMVAQFYPLPPREH